MKNEYSVAEVLSALKLAGSVEDYKAGVRLLRDSGVPDLSDSPKADMDTLIPASVVLNLRGRLGVHERKRQYLNELLAG